MKVKVKNAFIDKITKAFYKPGSEIEITGDERINDLVERGLIEPVKVEKAETETEPEEEPKEKAPAKKSARRR